MEGKNLFRFISEGFVQESFKSGDLTGLQFAGGDIEKGEAEDLSFRTETHQVMILTGAQVDGVRCETRSEDPDDLSLHNPFGQFRIFHLIAEGNFMPLLEKLGDIGFDRKVGDAAERDAIFPALISRGQCNIQFLRGHPGILEEHFIKITHPKEENRIRVLALNLEILFDHRGDRSIRH
jgi:hypothetical protein